MELIGGFHFLNGQGNPIEGYDYVGVGRAGGTGGALKCPEAFWNQSSRN